MSRNVALIFAGGIGTRMESDIPKQYIEVGGKAVLAWTLERFEDNNKIDAIYLVVARDWEERARELALRSNITKIEKIVSGGDKALASIQNGLVQMGKDGVNSDDLVLIHDGVRPIVSGQLLSENIEAASRLGNSICSRPAVETIAVVDGQTIASITDRADTRTLQAPQTFRFGDIFDAYQKAAADGLLDKCVDSAQVALAYGIKLHWLDGIKENIKLTTLYDLKYFQFLLDHNYEEIINA